MNDQVSRQYMAKRGDLSIEAQRQIIDPTLGTHMHEVHRNATPLPDLIIP